MNCFWRHVWTKWLDKEVLRKVPLRDKSPDTVGSPVIVQERRCTLCNKVQLRTEDPL